MNPRNLTRAQLADFATNTATAVAAGKVAGFLAAQNTSISDALTDAVAELKAADMDQVEDRAQSLQSTQIAEDKREFVLKILSDLRFSMKGVESPANEYDALGFDPPAETRSIVMPQTPTDLAGFGFSNGVNALTYSGNNAGGSVTYVIEAKIGDTAPYVIVGTSTRQSFKHTGVTPGQFYQYRV
ncbi:MAG: hypothetical protein ACMG55_15640, partial [Microcoleus sp.]